MGNYTWSESNRAKALGPAAGKGDREERVGRERETGSEGVFVCAFKLEWEAGHKIVKLTQFISFLSKIISISFFTYKCKYRI